MADGSVMCSVGDVRWWASNEAYKYNDLLHGSSNVWLRDRGKPHVQDACIMAIEQQLVLQQGKMPMRYLVSLLCTVALWRVS